MINALHVAPLATTAWSERKAVRISVAGEIDMANSPRLKAALLAVIERPIPPAEVKVDLSEVTFIDATGVRALLAGRQAAQRCGVGFAVQNAKGLVLRIFDIIGLTEVLHLANADADH